MISHAALANYIAWAVKTYFPNKRASFALHSPLSVDLTVTSIFAPLASGNRIVILREFNPAPTNVKRNLMADFESQARQFPERIALIHAGKTMSYGELNRRANGLARNLRDRGISTGDVVAILLPPSFSMVVAVLAAWKAGAAYSPVSNSLPHKRIERHKRPISSRSDGM